jgi:hypothetical protein
MDSIQDLVNRVMAEQCFEARCERWGKYACEGECHNHMCVEHGEKCLDCGGRFCLGCYPEHKHCRACGALGNLFSGLCGMCDAIWRHQHYEIARASEPGEVD